MGSLGGGAQKDSERRTRCTRGSAAIGGRPPALLRLILELELVEDEVMETEWRRTRGCEPTVEGDASDERVDVLGVEGLIKDGMWVGRGGDDDRRCWTWLRE